MRRPGRHLNRVGIGTFVVVVALVMGGCGGASGHRVDGSIIDDLVEQARAAGFVEQVAVLETGEVTDDDLLAATLRARSCVADLGLEVSEITRNYFGSLGYSFDVGSGADAEAKLAAADACQERFASLVQLAHSRLNPPPDDLAVRQVAACMELRGDELPSEIGTFEELLAAQGLEAGDGSSPLTACFREVTSIAVVVAS